MCELTSIKMKIFRAIVFACIMAYAVTSVAAAAVAQDEEEGGEDGADGNEETNSANAIGISYLHQLIVILISSLHYAIASFLKN